MPAPVRTLRGSAASPSAATTLTIPNVTVAAGEKLILMANYGVAATINSITHNGVSFRLVLIRHGTSVRCSLWDCIAPVPGTGNLVITLSASVKCVAAVIGFTGIYDLADPLDIVRASQGSGTTFSSSTPASATRHADELIVAIVATNTNNTPVWTNRTAGAYVSTTTPLLNLLEGYSVVSATGVYKSDGTISPLSAWGCIQATYRLTTGDEPAPAAVSGALSIPNPVVTRGEIGLPDAMPAAISAATPTLDLGAVEIAVAAITLAASALAPASVPQEVTPAALALAASTDAVALEIEGIEATAAEGATAAVTAPAPQGVDLGGLTVEPTALTLTATTDAIEVASVAGDINPAAITVALSTPTPHAVEAGMFTVEPGAVSLASSTPALDQAAPGSFTVEPAAVAYASTVGVPSTEITGDASPQAVEGALSVSVITLDIGGVTVEPAALAMSGAASAPALDLVALSEAVAATLAAGVVAVEGAITIEPDALALAASFPGLDAQTGVSPAALSLAASTDAPTVELGDGSGEIGLIIGALSVPAPSLDGAFAIEPAAVACTGTAAAPTPEGTFAVEPDTVSAGAAPGVVLVEATAQIEPQAVSLAGVVPQPEVAIGAQEATPDAGEGTFACGVVLLETGGLTIEPAALALAGTVGAPEPAGAFVVEPTAVACASTAPDPSLALEAVPGATSGALSVAVPLVEPGIVIVEPGAVASTGTAHAPTIERAGAEVLHAALALAASAPAPEILQEHQYAQPATITSAISVAIPNVDTGVSFAAPPALALRLVPRSPAATFTPRPATAAALVLLRASGPAALGDAAATPLVQAGPMGGTATLTVSASGFPNPAISALVDHVRFFALGRKPTSAGTPATASASRFTWNIGGDYASWQATSDPFPSSDDAARWGVLASDPITTQPNGAPWTLAAVHALAGVDVAQDFASGAGQYGVLAVGEVWVEVYGVERIIIPDDPEILPGMSFGVDAGTLTLAPNEGRAVREQGGTATLSY